MDRFDLPIVDGELVIARGGLLLVERVGSRRHRDPARRTDLTDVEEPEERRDLGLVQLGVDLVEEDAFGSQLALKLAVDVGVSIPEVLGLV